MSERLSGAFWMKEIGELAENITLNAETAEEPPEDYSVRCVWLQPDRGMPS